jgi:hypothetical protein
MSLLPLLLLLLLLVATWLTAWFAAYCSSCFGGSGSAGELRWRMMISPECSASRFVEFGVDFGPPQTVF